MAPRAELFRNAADASAVGALGETTEPHMTAPSQPPFDKPMSATPVEGEVAITGPGHIHGSMTPNAAKDSARRLRRVAEAAEQQPEADDEEEGPTR
jgi:hypothetical protein